MPDTDDKGKVKRGRGGGFAALDPERQREIARKGGKAIPAEKRSFSQNPGLASQAGRKGGLARRAKQAKRESPGVPLALD